MRNLLEWLFPGSDREEADTGLHMAAITSCLQHSGPIMLPVPLLPRPAEHNFHWHGRREIGALLRRRFGIEAAALNQSYSKRSAPLGTPECQATKGCKSEQRGSTFLRSQLTDVWLPAAPPHRSWQLRTGPT